MRFNPRQSPTLPRTLPFAAPLGYCAADRSHPKEVFYETTGQEGDRVLRFRLYDVQADEVRLVVNWQDMGPLAAGPVKAWSGTRAVTIPASLLKPAGAQRDRLRRPRRVPGVAALGRPRRDHLRTLRRLAP